MSAKRADGGERPAAGLVLRLYVAEGSADSLAAVANVSEAVAALPAGSWSLEVVDVHAEPARAAQDGVIVTPTLLRLAPAPARSIVGSLHDLRLLRGVLGVDDVEGRRRPAR